MPRQKAWKGEAPASTGEARRVLLDAARRVVERVGLAKAGLSDVAGEAGVTRQTVYRYFDSADDLFHSAAAFSSGGFHERLRARALTRPTAVERLVECLVFAIRELPAEPQLQALVRSPEYFSVEAALRMGFVQEEIGVLARGELRLEGKDRDLVAEVFLRLLHSFLVDPGPARSETELRADLLALLRPTLERFA